MGTKYKQTPLEAEKQRRICVAVWAYAYEYLSASIVSDAKFDAVCREIDLTQATDNAVMDIWFCENFNPSTGSWVGKHPHQKRLHELACRQLDGLGVYYE